MPILETKAAASASGFGGVGSGASSPVYIEDVFSTYLYTGNSSIQTITNGIALKGISASTQYTASGGISFSVDDNFKWQYVERGSPMRIYKQDTFSTEITLPGAGTSFDIGGSCTDSSGNNYYGILYTTGGIRYLHVIKTNSAGDTILWNRQIFAGDCAVFDVATDGTSVYFVGKTGNPDYKGILFSLSCSTGNINWHKGLTITYGVYLYTVALDTSGNVYVGGYTGGTTGASYGYVAKFNSGGTLQNQTNFINSDVTVKSICIDTNGDIYLGCTNGSQSYFIRKLNSSFTEQWVRVFTPTVNQATWIDIGIGTSTLTAVFTDATLNVTYAAVLDKNGNLLICNSVSGHMSIGYAAGQNRKPIYKNNKLFLLLDKIYVIDESAITTNNNLLSGGGLSISATSLAFTSDSNPSNSTWSYNTATPTLTITKSSYTPSGISVAGVEGKGGLVWCKSRSTVSYDHLLFDTSRGINQSLNTTLAVGQQTTASSLTAFNSDGFSLGSANFVNGTAGGAFVSWTFREQAKFFDVVTYTGNGANRTISHNLGSVPGCIVVKRTDAAADWQVYHRSLANTQYLVLNTTAAVATGTTRWNSTTPTSTVFSLGTDSTVNASGGTYVAYLFAHDAGGFGLSGTDNVISCGSFTTDGSGNATVTLGYEPQFILMKRSTGISSWTMVDVSRGWVNTPGSFDSILYADTSGAEFTNSRGFPTATGFQLTATDSGIGSLVTYIYIAIRRGPMKTPTSGTSVFSPNTSSAASGTKITTNFPIDAQLGSDLVGTSNRVFVDRLRGISTNATGAGQTLLTNSTAIEASDTGSSLFWDNTGFQMNANFGGAAAVFWNFRRAPGFFDEVCYTGTGSAQTLSHNLGVTPELMIVKWRTGATGDNWNVYHSAIGATGALYLNKTDATVGTAWNNTAPTATQFTVGTQGSVSAATYVAYLFATCAGVSKVGSYTGTGALQTIDCGFTGGARFVLIKRTDSTGDWYVYDSARGISSGNDPYLFLNSTAAEVTGTNYVDTTSVGFQVTAAAPAGLNANGGTYIFLAIA